MRGAMRARALPSPEEDRASGTPHYDHNPPFQHCSDSRRYFCPDTHDLLRSVDGDIHRQCAWAEHRRREQDILPRVHPKRAGVENVAASLIDVRLSQVRGV